MNVLKITFLFNLYENWEIIGEFFKKKLYWVQTFKFSIKTRNFLHFQNATALSFKVFKFV